MPDRLLTPPAQPPAPTPTLTPERIEAHLRAMLPHMKAVPIERLRDDLSVGCVDGRRSTCAASAPGGNAGLFLLMLGALEATRGQALSDEETDVLLGSYLDRFGAFYFHSDAHAAARLACALGLPPEADLGRVFREAAPEERAALLRAATEPEHVGCGHLRRLLEDPQGYGMRPGLAEAGLRALFRRLWLGDTRIAYAVLNGDHMEGAVVRVRARTSQGHPLPLATLCPHFGELDLFVYHPDAVAYLEAAHGLHLAETGHLAPAEIAAFIATQHTLSERQLRATLGALAPTLPVFDVEIRSLGTLPSGLAVCPAGAP
ncbi:MAG: hypothetical protein ACK41D_07510 [Rubricoccaceae bacterium]